MFFVEWFFVEWNGLNMNEFWHQRKGYDVAREIIILSTALFQNNRKNERKILISELWRGIIFSVSSKGSVFPWLKFWNKNHCAFCFELSCEFILKFSIHSRVFNSFHNFQFTSKQKLKRKSSEIRISKTRKSHWSIQMVHSYLMSWNGNFRRIQRRSAHSSLFMS